MSTADFTRGVQPPQRFRHWPITASQARWFYRQHWTGRFPAHVEWHWVMGLERLPEYWDYSYLIAGNTGLMGIVGRAGG